MQSMMSRWAFALGMGLFASALAGCGAEPGAGTSEGEVGAVELEIMSAPSDVKCLRLTVRNPLTEQVAVRTFTLTTGQSSAKFAVTGLPLGSVKFLGEGFNVACGSVVAATPFTWTSDAVTLNLVSGFTQNLQISLNRAGTTNLGVDFVAGVQMEEITGVTGAWRLAAAPSGGSVVALSASALWRVTSSGAVTQLAPVPVQTQAVAITSSGNIVVAGVPMLGVYSPTGTLLWQIDLGGFEPSDLAIDSTNAAWVAFRNGTSVARVTGIETGVLLRTDVFVPPSAPGLSGVATVGDSVRYVSSSFPRMLAIASTGAILWDRLLGPTSGLRRVVVASDSTLWGATTDGRVFRTTADGMLTQPVGGPFGAGTGELALASSIKGVFLALGTPQFYRFDPAVLGGPPTIYALPASTPSATITGLAVASDGRLWLADRAKSRLIAVTLP